MNHVSLFSGCAGIDIGLMLAIQNISTCCYIEHDTAAVGVLISRMQDGSLPHAPIWDDIRTFNGRPWRGCVDIISGGFPCKRTSIAFQGQRGIEFGESALWKEMFRVVCDIRPSLVFVENPTGIDTAGIERVFADLASEYYNAESTVVSAGQLGANHLRKRRFILAYTPGKRLERIYKLRNSNSLQLAKGQIRGEWLSEPGMDRVAHGVPNRVDRSRILGNSCTPQQAALAFSILSERIKMTEQQEVSV